MLTRLADWLVKRWYASSPKALILLWPLEWLFIRLAKRRRLAYQQGKKPSVRLPVPVVIVGNLHLGGSGKSPLVAALAQHFAGLGYKSGIISRGYGGKAAHYPLRVTSTSLASEVGDEPLMLVQQTGLPVAVSPKRPEAAQLLIAEGCNLLFADDGLQHYALQRDIELVVLDAKRGWGNGHCLPVGPLREGIERLAKVDWLVVQQQKNLKENLATKQKLDEQLANISLKNPTVYYSLEVSSWRNLAGTCQHTLPFMQGQEVNALAAISQPEKFFSQLEGLGLMVNRYPKADHAQLNEQDLELAVELPLVITAKDAVKLLPLAKEIQPVEAQARLLANIWVLEVKAKLPSFFLASLEAKISQLAKVKML